MNLYDDEGNAAELNFGPEFSTDDASCLTNDELATLLLTQLKNEQGRGPITAYVVVIDLLYALLRFKFNIYQSSAADIRLRQESGAPNRRQYFAFGF
jgi:hypothetical protein